MTKGKRKSKDMTNKITNISPTKKQNPISTSKLAEGDIKDLRNKILKKEQQQKKEKLL